jgi:aminoglycoside phosphotransferase (APT) family kinase protein
MGEAMTPRSAGIVHRVADDLLQGWDEGFDRMSLAMGSSESPSDVARLRGGLEAETFAFRLAGDRFVVKIYDVDSADQASTEFDNLGVVSLARVATPEPVLMDHNGEWFRTPAIVMSALPGQPDMRPSDRQRWTDGAAEALASIHEIPPARTTDARLPRWQRWWPSTDGMGSDSSRADLLLAQFREEAGRLPVVVSHDDFNPGNLLFDGGRLSGVVDWADIVVEPRHAAVALFRHFLAIHPGGEAPELFLDSYEHAARTSLNDIHLWDVLYGLRGVRPGLDHWVLAFDGLGLDVTANEIRDRSWTWVRKAMSLAGG